MQFTNNVTVATHQQAELLSLMDCFFKACKDFRPSVWRSPMSSVRTPHHHQLSLSTNISQMLSTNSPLSGLPSPTTSCLRHKKTGKAQHDLLDSQKNVEKSWIDSKNQDSWASWSTAARRELHTDTERKGSTPHIWGAFGKFVAFPGKTGCPTQKSCSAQAYPPHVHPSEATQAALARSCSSHGGKRNTGRLLLRSRDVCKRDMKTLHIN